MYPSDAIDVFISCELRGVWRGIENCFLKILGRAKPAFDLHHASDRQPRHRDSLEYHNGRGDCVGGEDGISEADRVHALLPSCFGDPPSTICLAGTMPNHW